MDPSTRFASFLREYLWTHGPIYIPGLIVCGEFGEVIVVISPRRVEAHLSSQLGEITFYCQEWYGISPRWGGMKLRHGEDAWSSSKFSEGVKGKEWLDEELPAEKLVLAGIKEGKGKDL